MNRKKVTKQFSAKTLFCFIVLVVTTFSFNSCSNDDDKEKEPLANEKGVIINGVKWATCNIDSPGTFASNPEDAGMFYQWNRKKAWIATGSVSGWNSSTPSGTTWEKANDPSPAGWRIPTLSDFETLFEYGKVTNEWIIVNGIKGKKFTDVISGDSIFLPASGTRFFGDGMLVSEGTNGFYWSNTMHTSYESAVYCLNLIGSDAATTFASGRSSGYSLRCVAE